MIVDTIVKILPDRIADIVDGSSVRVVDHAVLPTQRSSPSYTKYTLIGLILGFVVQVLPPQVLLYLSQEGFFVSIIHSFLIPFLLTAPSYP